MMIENRMLSNPLVWEASDLEESFEQRRYLCVRNMLCVLDPSVFNKTFTYTKHQTKLGYDVSLKYEKYDDYIKILYAIDSADYQEIIRYSSYITKNFLQITFQAEMIRERTGRILDNFFLFLLPDEFHNEFKIEKNDDHDPLDGIVDFTNNPSYMNGGYYYFAPMKNNFIYDFTDEENNIKKSIDLYNGTLLGCENQKVQYMISQLTDMLIIGIDDYDKNIYNGIDFFLRNLFKNKNNTWFDYKNFKFRRKENSENMIVIQFKNKISRNIGEINFGYHEQNKNPNNEQIKKIVTSYKSITDKYLQNFIFMEFINSYITHKNFLASDEIGNFINTIIEYNLPEKYIDDIVDILTRNNDDIEDMLSLYISYALIPYKKSCFMYSGVLFDLVSYFLDAIINKKIEYYSLKILQKPFINIRVASGDLYYEQISEHFFPVDMAIRILYTYKIAHEKQSDDMLLQQIISTAKNIQTNQGVKKSDINYKILYKRQEILILTIILSKLACLDNDILPHHITNICKLYIKDYRQYKADWIYDGNDYTKIASKYDINLLMSLNMVINKMIKDQSSRNVIMKIIMIINYLAGGKTNIIDNSHKEPLKIFAFFMLNSDRLESDILDEYFSFIQRLDIPYPYECSLEFDSTIKNILISQMMPLLWENELTELHFDDLNDIIKPFDNGCFDKNEYEMVKNKLSAYLTGI